MVGFVEVLKWYAIILLSIIELAYIYNMVKALVIKENRIQYIAGFLLYLPIFMLAIWALGHGYY